MLMCSSLVMDWTEQFPTAGSIWVSWMAAILLEISAETQCTALHCTSLQCTSLHPTALHRVLTGELDKYSYPDTSGFSYPTILETEPRGGVK